MQHIKHAIVLPESKQGKLKKAIVFSGCVPVFSALVISNNKNEQYCTPLRSLCRFESYESYVFHEFICQHVCIEIPNVNQAHKANYIIQVNYLTNQFLFKCIVLNKCILCCLGSDISHKQSRRKDFALILNGVGKPTRKA